MACRQRLFSPGPTNLRKGKRYWIKPGAQQEFLIGKGRSVLLALRHFAARNIYNLIHRSTVEKSIHRNDFNCHTTAGIVLGERKETEWGSADFRGQLLSVGDALAQFPLPCGMQIHDSPECRVVLHSAVLLGVGRDGLPIAFHKDGNLPMEFRPVGNIIDEYRTCYYDCLLSFYHPEKP